ncbi:MAG TPA: VOC family protein [Lacipirellulaceae bacterium]|jgi:catechol 2,3-dioxygenase-like lactoylglutathione lyase family enzyme|nr:VOC family protein [Lacipirellulaceae bacterium]
MPVNVGHRVLPCLLVSDMRRALDFYIEVLGFTQTGYYPIESDPIRTEIRRDDVAIILYTDAVHGSDGTPAFTGALYAFPENVDLLAAELKGKVPFAWGPEDTEYDYREFAIRDPDGYTLVFAERTKPPRV